MNAFQNLVHSNTGRQLDGGLQQYGDDLRDLSRGTAVLWKSGVTFRNACDISILYITGLITGSPYHAGPILSESNTISKDLITCTRNGLLTVSSEPVQSDVSLLGKPYTVTKAFVEFWIKAHNYEFLISQLNLYPNRFKIDVISYVNKDHTFSRDFGNSYIIEDGNTVAIAIYDTVKNTNEMYSILANISKNFTDLPSYANEGGEEGEDY